MYRAIICRLGKDYSRTLNVCLVNLLRTGKLKYGEGVLIRSKADQLLPSKVIVTKYLGKMATVMLTLILKKKKHFILHLMFYCNLKTHN